MVGIFDLLGSIGGQIAQGGGVGSNEPVIQAILRGRQRQQLLEQQQTQRQQLGGVFEEAGLPTLGGLASAGASLSDITEFQKQRGLEQRAAQRQNLIQSILGQVAPQPIPAEIGGQIPVGTTPPIVAPQPALDPRLRQAQALLLDPSTAALGRELSQTVREEQRFAREQAARIAEERRRPRIEAQKKAAVRKEEAIAELPGITDQSNEAIRLIDELLASPGLESAVGAKGITGGFLGFDIPATEAADFVARFEQIKGKQFLAAFQSLKGGGQITEAEGKKATQAISRMSRSQTEVEFKKAANEFKAVVAKGLKRAKKAAGVSDTEIGEIDVISQSPEIQRLLQIQAQRQAVPQQAPPTIIRFDAQGNRL